jgi:multiple sugar transport system permease protein
MAELSLAVPANRRARRPPMRWLAANGLALLLILPSIVIVFAYIVLPALNLLWLSFTDYSPGLDARFVGLSNYVSLLTDPAFQAATLRNIVYVFGVVTLQVGVGLLIALLLDNPLPFRALWMALLIAPYAVSPIVAVVMWKYMLDPSFGLVNYAISSLGIPRIPWFSDPLTSMFAVLVVAVWSSFSFTAIVAFAALRSIPGEMLEAARVDGATPRQILFAIKLPLILPALSIVILFEVIYAIREFGIIQTMTGGGPGTSTEIFSLYLYRQAFSYFDFGKGSAVGWIMLLVTLLLSGVLVRRTYRGMFPVRHGGR